MDWLRSCRSDRAATRFALFTATAMIAHQVGGKATRDALFLSSFSVTDLPKVVMASGLLSILAVGLVSVLLARMGPARLIPRMFALSASMFVAEWQLLHYHPLPAAVLIYLHMSVFGLILISGFWSVVNERFDPHTAKRSIARIAAAATLGGVIGGVGAERVTAILDLPSMLLVLSSLHVLCMFGVLGIGEPQRTAGSEPAVDLLQGGRILKRQSYLRMMMALVIAAAMAAALLDYVFKAEVKANYPSGEELVRFFAVFYAFVGVLSFTLQSTLGHRLLKRLGLGGTLALMPLGVLFGGVMGAAVMHLWTAVILRGAQVVLTNSVFRAGFELLYTPVPAEQKRPTKTLIDVGAERLGDILGGGLILMLLGLVTELPDSILVLLAALLAAVVLGLVVLLKRGYVRQLGDNLRSGAVILAEDEVVDATTEATLAGTNMAIDRRDLLDRIARMQRQQDGLGMAEAKAPARVEADDRLAGKDDGGRLLREMRDLCSGQPGLIRQILGQEHLDPRLVARVIELLGEAGVEHDAIQALRHIGDPISGQLVDALVWPEQSPLVRRRLPLVLEVCHSERAANGLLLGMDDGLFEVRYRCGQALRQIMTRQPGLTLERERLFVLAETEAAAQSAQWRHNGLIEAGGSPRIDRGLRHVFTLLGLAEDMELLELTLRALFSQDQALRGTALEYLESILPEGLRGLLWEHLEPGGGGGGRRRPHEELIEALRRSARDGAGPAQGA